MADPEQTLAVQYRVLPSTEVRITFLPRKSRVVHLLQTLEGHTIRKGPKLPTIDSRIKEDKIYDLVLIHPAVVFYQLVSHLFTDMKYDAPLIPVRIADSEAEHERLRDVACADYEVRGSYMSWKGVEPYYTYELRVLSLDMMTQFEMYTRVFNYDMRKERIILVNPYIPVIPTIVTDSLGKGTYGSVYRWINRTNTYALKLAELRRFQVQMSVSRDNFNRRMTYIQDLYSCNVDTVARENEMLRTLDNRRMRAVIVPQYDERIVVEGDMVRIANAHILEWVIYSFLQDKSKHMTKMYGVFYTGPTEDPATRVATIYEMNQTTLRDFLRLRQNRRYTVGYEGISLLIQCLKALEFLHENGVMHLDMKSDNIMLNNSITTDEFLKYNDDQLVANVTNHVVKLIDFGISYYESSKGRKYVHRDIYENPKHYKSYPNVFNTAFDVLMLIGAFSDCPDMYRDISTFVQEIANTEADAQGVPRIQFGYDKHYYARPIATDIVNNLGLVAKINATYILAHWPPAIDAFVNAKREQMLGGSVYQM